MTARSAARRRSARARAARSRADGVLDDASRRRREHVRERAPGCGAARCRQAMRRSSTSADCSPRTCVASQASPCTPTTQPAAYASSARRDAPRTPLGVAACPSRERARGWPSCAPSSRRPAPRRLRGGARRRRTGTLARVPRAAPPRATAARPRRATAASPSAATARRIPSRAPPAARAIDGKRSAGSRLQAAQQDPAQPARHARPLARRLAHRPRARSP